MTKDGHATIIGQRTWAKQWVKTRPTPGSSNKTNKDQEIRPTKGQKIGHMGQI
jgi:hypothetical protein